MPSERSVVVVCCVLMAAPLWAQSQSATSRVPRFLGITTPISGDSGVVALIRRCQAEFGPNSHMCTSAEVLASVLLPAPDDYHSQWGWVQPVIAGVAPNTFTDVSGVTAEFWFGLNCQGWSFASAGGLVVSALAGDKEGQLVANHICESPVTGVACCGVPSP